MTGVSDLPFRRIASACGAPYVATEMVACDSFARGRPDVVRRAAVGNGLPLMVIQLVGRTPDGNTVRFAIATPLVARICDLVCGHVSERIRAAFQAIR